MTTASQDAHAHEMADATLGERDRALRTGLSIAIVLFLLAMGIGDLSEWCNYPGRGPVVVRFYLVEVAVCALALVATRAARLRAQLPGVALFTAATLVISGNWYSAIVASQGERQALVQVCLLTAFSVLLPLGWPAQLAVVVGSVATYVAAVPYLAFADRALYPLLALVCGGAASVVNAWFNARYRRAMETQAADARLIAELESASELKSEFVATMSHELRTPLNILVGYNDLLREEELGPLTSTQRDALARSRVSALQLLELVNATLDVARLDRGREAVDIVPVALGELVRELSAELGPLTAPGVVLRWRNLTAGVPLHTDRAKLKRIVANLVNNALKFTDAGAIDVTFARVERTVLCTVRDTGIGIPAAQLPWIFEQFHQVDRSPTRRHGGIGLGLHIVQRLVRLLRGSVSVESTVGVGSVFTVAVPDAVADADSTSGDVAA